MAGPQPARSFAVIAYVHGPAERVDAYPIEELTHLNYSFLHLEGNRLRLRAHDSLALAHLVALRSRNPRLKIIISVGGWGGCETCSAVFATDEGRREFAESAREILERTHTHGIDLDWEYPAIEGYPGHRYSPDDRHNFTLLVAELRKTLGDSLEISFAAGGFRDCLEQSIEWRQVAPLVDKVNLMSYDLVNGNSTSTGHHAPLFSTPEQRESADHAVCFLDSVGIPRNKIIIGAAFYARVWENVDTINNGLYQQGTFKRSVGYRTFGEYFGEGFSTFYRWDSVAHAPYWYDPGQKLFATFDDLRSVAFKTRYALHRGLGGIMFWELTGDTPRGGLLESITRTRESTP